MAHSHPDPAAKSDRQTTRTVQAFLDVRMKIVRLELAPGSAFTEGELATQLGLSKTPVREALLMLATDGLVFARAGAGYTVAPVTIRDTRALFAHRRLLEGEAAARLARTGIDGHTQMHLEEAIKGAGDTADTQITANTLFHATLVNQVGDKYLVRDLQRVLLDLERVLRLVAQTVTPPRDQGHKKLLDAILRGDVDAARQAAVDHADETERFVIDALLSADVLQQVNLGGAGG